MIGETFAYETPTARFFMFNDKYHPLFLRRLKHPELGIYREYTNPVWPVDQPFERIELGFADVSKQIDHIAAHPELKFSLSVGVDKIDWRPFVSILSKLPNIRAIEGSGLRLEDLKRFENLEHLYVGEGCEKFGLAEMPSVKSLAADFDDHDWGLSDAVGLKSLEMSFAVNKKFDFSTLRANGRLENLRITHGRFEDFGFLEGCSNLKILTLQPASWLKRVEGLSALSQLSWFYILQAKKVSDWTKFPCLPHLENLSIVECGSVQLPKCLGLRPQRQDWNFYGSTVSYLE